jgi:biopolymer transport protein ExbD
MAFGDQHGSGQIQEINDINITPFVDVVLVLLVIFIVTAPMMMKDLIEVTYQRHQPRIQQPPAPLRSPLRRKVRSWSTGK